MADVNADFDAGLAEAVADLEPCGDLDGAPAWHRWALAEAFRAGVLWQGRRNQRTIAAGLVDVMERLGMDVPDDLRRAAGG